MFYMEGYQHYDKGNYPNGLPWLQEPMKFMEAMKIIGKAYQDLTQRRKGK